MTKEEKKWFLRSMFIRFTYSKSKEEIKEKNKILEVKLTPMEIATIEEILEFKMSDVQIDAINEILRKASIEENKKAEEDDYKPAYSKAEYVIKVLKASFKDKLDEQKELIIRQSIKQKLTMDERNEIIERKAKTAKFKTGIASVFSVSFIGRTTSTKALMDATNIQQKKNTIEMDNFNSQDDIKNYIKLILEEEYNEVTNNNINVLDVNKEETAEKIYRDNEGMARFSTEKAEELQTITSIKVTDENGNITILKYALINGEYVRVYENGEELYGDQTLKADVIYLVHEGLLWCEEYYNENTLYTVDENGQKVIKKDNNGNEIHPSDLVEDDFRKAVQAYKERKIQN